jgi:putative hydrolase of the HAD superfamily
VKSVERDLGIAQAVFFDFGDTLASLEPTREAVFVKAARSIGLELDLETVRRAYQIVEITNKYSSVTVTDRDAFYHNYNRELVEVLGISSHFATLGPALIEHFKREKHWQLFSDTAPALSRLHESGRPLALVANWDKNLPTLIERLSIAVYFSCVVASEAVGVEKPDPAIFQIALAELSLRVPEQMVLYIGNEYRADVLGARAAGLTPVLIDRYALYPHADCHRFASLDELVTAIMHY